MGASTSRASIVLSMDAFVTRMSGGSEAAARLAACCSDGTSIRTGRSPGFRKSYDIRSGGPQLDFLGALLRDAAHPAHENIAAGLTINQLQLAPECSSFLGVSGPTLNRDTVVNDTVGGHPRRREQPLIASDHCSDVPVSTGGRSDAPASKAHKLRQ